MGKSAIQIKLLRVGITQQTIVAETGLSKSEVSMALSGKHPYKNSENYKFIIQKANELIEQKTGKKKIAS